jgi:hypothetical protein
MLRLLAVVDYGLPTRCLPDFRACILALADIHFFALLKLGKHFCYILCLLSRLIPLQTNSSAITLEKWNCSALQP